jgi:hypothetical protein
MNSKHVQTFLMVSAAFFAMSAPVRSNSAQTPLNAVRASYVAPATPTVDRSGSSSQSRSGD